MRGSHRAIGAGPRLDAMRTAIKALLRYTRHATRCVASDDPRAVWTCGHDGVVNDARRAMRTREELNAAIALDAAQRVQERREREALANSEQGARDKADRIARRAARRDFTARRMEKGAWESPEHD